MVAIKLIKNNAYFKKFQVKKRRRREGKTDFHARTKMIKQAKNKYNSPKYRLVVRITNQQCICQIVYATMAGDKVMTQANSKELPRYGIKAGLKNFAACYATGLLVARRLLNILDVEEAFEGVAECDGEEFHIEDEIEDEERRPFKVVLDVGLRRTTIGAKCFAAMKGAVDGGLHVPHSIKRFPGYRAPEEKGAEAEFDADALKDRIFGSHVSEYMSTMEEEDAQKYESHFAKFIENGMDADGLEDIYKNAHEAIRKDPKFTKKTKPEIKRVQRGMKMFVGDGDKWIRRNVRRGKKERMGIVAAKMREAGARALAAMGEEEEEEE